MKRIITEEEELILQIDKMKNVEENNKVFMNELFKFKFDMKEITADRKDQESLEQNQQWLSSLYQIESSDKKPQSEFLEEILEKQKEKSKEKLNEFDDKYIEMKNQQEELSENQIEIEEKIRVTEEKNIEFEKKIEELEKKINEVQKESERRDIVNERDKLNESLKKGQEELRLMEMKNKSIDRKIHENINFIDKLQNQINQIKELQEKNLTKKEKIVRFFSSSEENTEKLKKLRDYFVYLQKGVMKFYAKAVIVEADMFKIKHEDSLVEKGVGFLAGSVPFIGGVLEQAFEAFGKVNNALEDRNLFAQCMKFSTIIPSSQLLSEIIEDVAFELIQDEKKVNQIFSIESESNEESFCDKIERLWENWKEKVSSIFTKPKKKEKVLKDLNTPIKIMANIDSTFICTKAPLFYSNQTNAFNPNDIYNIDPLIKIFKEAASLLEEKHYKKALDFLPNPSIPKILVHEKVAEIIIEQPGKKIDITDCLETPEERKIDIPKVFELDYSLYERIESMRKKQTEALIRIEKMKDNNKTQFNGLKNHDERLEKIGKSIKTSEKFAASLMAENNLIKDKFDEFGKEFEEKFNNLMNADSKKDNNNTNSAVAGDSLKTVKNLKLLSSLKIK